MAADALAPCVARPSAVMPLTMLDKIWSLSSAEEDSTICAISVLKNDRICKYVVIPKKKNQSQRTCNGFGGLKNVLLCLSIVITHVGVSKMGFVYWLLAWSILDCIAYCIRSPLNCCLISYIFRSTISQVHFKLGARIVCGVTCPRCRCTLARRSFRSSRKPLFFRMISNYSNAHGRMAGTNRSGSLNQ